MRQQSLLLFQQVIVLGYQSDFTVNTPEFNNTCGQLDSIYTPGVGKISHREADKLYDSFILSLDGEILMNQEK